MNNLDPLEIEHPIQSDSSLEELIDHIGDLLAEKYFQFLKNRVASNTTKTNESRSSMKVAIYARYSSEIQRPQSIDD